MSGFRQAVYAMRETESLRKQEIKATKELAYGGKQKSDTSSESSDESTCTLETVNPMGTSDKRPLKKVLINGVSVTVLPDSGATVSAMDEATFKRYGLEEKDKKDKKDNDKKNQDAR